MMMSEKSFSLKQQTMSTESGIHFLLLFGVGFLATRMPRLQLPQDVTLMTF